MSIRLLPRRHPTSETPQAEPSAASTGALSTNEPSNREVVGDAQDEQQSKDDDAIRVETSSKPTLSPWKRRLVFLVLPIVVLIATAAVAYLRYEKETLGTADAARAASVQAARDATTAILSYRPDTVEQDLAAAQSKLTGSFRDSYASLTRDVVIPGAKQKQVSAEASVPAAASVSATGSHAVVLVYVNQAVIVGNDAPSSTMSSVRVTLDKVDGAWLVSGFDPV
ncbi:hypothetical protein [Mycobacterium sp. Root135]|uniref:hypothetical protein n=1 Tax=Mycobacterium sp. Root135 TaxID=1736457 RepID=UPI0009E7263E|nr:hypothetical protein [Mycobacterium sp. Root135]